MNVHHMVISDIISGFKTGCADNHCANHHVLISATTFSFSSFQLYCTFMCFTLHMPTGGNFGKIRREAFQLGKVGL